MSFLLPVTEFDRLARLKHLMSGTVLVWNDEANLSTGQYPLRRNLSVPVRDSWQTSKPTGCRLGIPSRCRHILSARENRIAQTAKKNSRGQSPSILISRCIQRAIRCYVVND